MVQVPTNPLPRRVAWFAPWTWRPWKRWAIAGLLFTGYALSPVPVNYALRCAQTPPDSPMMVSAAFTLFPLTWLRIQSPLVNGFYEMQWRWMTKAFGTPPPFLHAVD